MQKPQPEQSTDTQGNSYRTPTASLHPALPPPGTRAPCPLRCADPGRQRGWPGIASITAARPPPLRDAEVRWTKVGQNATPSSGIEVEGIHLRNPLADAPLASSRLPRRHRREPRVVRGGGPRAGQRAGTPFRAFAPARSSPERRTLTDMCMEAVEAPAAHTPCQIAGIEAGRAPARARDLPPQAIEASRAPRPRARNAARRCGITAEDVEGRPQVQTPGRLKHLRAA